MNRSDRKFFWQLYLENWKRWKIFKKNISRCTVPKLRLVKISNWSTKCSDQEFYSNIRNFWHFFNFLIFVYQISQKLIKFEIWNKHQKLRMIFTCDLYKFYTDQPTVVGVSYAELEVKIYNILVILTKKFTCYISL